jgi:hypothetical protein
MVQTSTWSGDSGAMFVYVLLFDVVGHNGATDILRCSVFGRHVFYVRVELSFLCSGCMDKLCFFVG